MQTVFFKKDAYWLAPVSFLVLLAITASNYHDQTQLQRTYPAASIARDTSNWPETFGFGRAASPAEIAVLDISIKPDGSGLPAGAGNVATGKQVYAIKCMACHGQNGTGGPFSALVTTPVDSSKAKTIGNYWPYATTLFDYIRRAMPFNQPGSLSNNDVYSITAYLLYKNNIMNQATVLSAASLPKIIMPARQLFVNDDRHGGPEVK